MVRFGKLIIRVRTGFDLSYFWRTGQALSLLLLLLTACADDEPEQEETQEAISLSTLNDKDFYADVPAVISPVELKDAIDGGDPPAIIDVRKREGFVKGHIPGAKMIWRSDIEDTNDTLQGIMAQRIQLEYLFSLIGIQDGQDIVVYDDRGNVNAARVWWLCKHYGHHNVRILNGGLQGWEMSGFELEKGESTRVTGVTYMFTGPGDLRQYASTADVKEAMNDDEIVLLDVRKPDEYSGARQKKGAYRAGHIPNSVLMDYVTAINAGEGEDFSFKPIKILQEDLDKVGINGAQKIVVYCHSGYRSSLTTFVMTEILGYNFVKNYDGGWVEWSANDSLPIELTVK